MKKQNITMCIAFLLFMLIASNFHSANAASGNEWAVKWHQYGYWWYTPINVSSTTTVIGAQGHCRTTVVVTASIYEYSYDPIADMDYVYFRLVVYVKAEADEGYQPQFADYVCVNLKKIAYVDDTVIHIIHDEAPSYKYSQGEGLDQINMHPSTPEERTEWVIVPLQFAAAAIFEPAGIANLLISWADAFEPTAGIDIVCAPEGEYLACSRWWGSTYSEVGPVRQYCYNAVRWKQRHSRYPGTPFAIKIEASVCPWTPHVIPWFLTNPIYLKIFTPINLGGGGAGNLRPCTFR